MLRRLVDRHLDPSESLLEILFGLIMALTMTAGAIPRPSMPGS